MRRSILGGASTEPIHDATATSYSAVCRKANDASFFRSSSVNPPARTAASTPSYPSGSTTTATLGWFFAAARTIDGPPMSICSTHSSMLAPESTVSVNGYRLTTTSSNAAMPSSASAETCSGLR